MGDGALVRDGDGDREPKIDPPCGQVSRGDLKGEGEGIGL